MSESIRREELHAIFGPKPDPVVKAKAMLAARGFVVLREKSYRQAQERQRVAECRAQSADEWRASNERWAREELCGEIRDLRSRCTYLYGVARSLGASAEDLAGDSVNGRA